MGRLLIFIISTNTGNKSACEANSCDLVKECERLYQELVGNKKTADKIATSEILNSVHIRVAEERNKIKESSGTATLWLQYMDMVDILVTFIKAERTTNWDLHLKTTSKMLSLVVLQATAYTPSVRISICNRCRFSNSHVVRKSDRYWASLSTDLVIEQVLMRSLKNTGGLTRGSGLTE